MGDYVFEFHESRKTLGGGKRKREIVTWECVWNVPGELVGTTKVPLLRATSTNSKADAQNKVEAMIRELLEEDSHKK